MFRFFLFGFWALPLLADINGKVTDELDQPVEGARVRVQTSLMVPVISAADGSFVLPWDSGGMVTLTAALPYDVQAAVNFLTTSETVMDGSTGVVIILTSISENENTNYFPIKARTPDGCGDCHSMHLNEWEQSRHADTAQNTWVRELYTDWAAANPGETGFCASCHSPTADSQDPGNVFLNDIDNLLLLKRLSAQEGVNCSACHQIDHVNDNFENLHLAGNATMRFPLDGAIAGTHEYVWGPLDDVDYPFMKAVYSPQIGRSEFCATCHEYNTPNTDIPAQSTYSEWAASDFGNPLSPAFADCQDCHMERAEGEIELCDPPTGFGSGPTRDGSSHASHLIEGTTQAGLAASLDLSLSVDVTGSDLWVSVSVQNHGNGHSFPTGISIRNSLLRVRGFNTTGTELVQTGGGLIPFYGSDADGNPDPEDWAGLPGKGFAKVLVDDVGNKPVLFIDAVAVDSDTRIPSGATDTSAYQFSLGDITCNGEPVEVQVSLIYRRVWRALAVERGWTTDNQGLPWELPLKQVNLELSLQDLAILSWLEPNVIPTLDQDTDGHITILDILRLESCQ